MKESLEFRKLPLRQRKLARTRVGLLHAALEALRERSLDEVTVKELCEQVGISEASFFNYFPRKSDLLVYYVQLWSLEMAWHARRGSGRKGGLAGIEDLFQRTARRIGEHASVMLEIIAGQLRMAGRPAVEHVALAERLLVFPDLPGIEEEEAMGVEELLPPLLARAVRAGELPPKTNTAEVQGALTAIFFGVPVVHGRAAAAAVGEQYRKQLAWLWAGVRAST